MIIVISSRTLDQLSDCLAGDLAFKILFDHDERLISTSQLYEQRLDNNEIVIGMLSYCWCIY